MRHMIGRYLYKNIVLFCVKIAIQVFLATFCSSSPCPTSLPLSKRSQLYTSVNKHWPKVVITSTRGECERALPQRLTLCRPPIRDPTSLMSQKSVSAHVMADWKIRKNLQSSYFTQDHNLGQPNRTGYWNNNKEYFPRGGGWHMTEDAWCFVLWVLMTINELCSINGLQKCFDMRYDAK